MEHDAFCWPEGEFESFAAERGGDFDAAVLRLFSVPVGDVDIEPILRGAGLIAPKVGPLSFLEGLCAEVGEREVGDVSFSTTRSAGKNPNSFTRGGVYALKKVS